MVEEGINVFIIGTAGCGKSSLTGAFKTWVTKMGFNCFVINLDPGAEGLAYEPDLDIREWISLIDVMEEYGLGPNGAQIVSADLLALNMPKILERKKGVQTDYFIIDTPGQMELFTFRSSSMEIIKALGENSFIVYMLDGLNAQTPYTLTSQLMLSATTQFRFGIPAMNVLGKKDLIPPEDLDRIIKWTQNSEALYEAAKDQVDMEGSPHLELGLGFLQVIEDQAAFTDLYPVSADTGEGLEDIYNIIQQIYSGGEELEKE
jgi:GTPase SAR1 family protein